MPELYAGAMLWPWERASEVLHAWRAWTLDAPETATTSVRILQVPPVPEIPEILRGRKFVVIDGAVLGSAAYADEVLAPLRALGPEIDMFAAAPPVALSHLHMDPEHPVPGIGDHALLSELTPEAIDAFVAAAGHESGSPLRWPSCATSAARCRASAAGAGARSRMEPRTSVRRRLADDAGARRGDPGDAVAAARRARPVEVADGAYLNFAEQPTDISTAFEEDTFAALQAVKAEYDPPT